MSNLRPGALLRALPLLLALGASGAVAQAASAAPVVTALSDNEGLNLGGNAISIYGSGFTGATNVHIGTAGVPFTVVSDTRIDVKPTPLGSPTGGVTVTAGGVTSPSDSIGYTILTGPGNIHGSHALSCSFDNGPIVGANLRFDIDGKISLPAVSPGGNVSLAGLRASLQFTDASTVPVTADNKLTITSYNFTTTGATDPSFTVPGGSVSLVNVNETTPIAFSAGIGSAPAITAATPGGHDVVVSLGSLAGTAKVIKNGDILSTVAFACTPTDPATATYFRATVTGAAPTPTPPVPTPTPPPVTTAPQITALSSVLALNLADAKFSIFGSGFTGATAVHVGSAPMQFTVVSDSRIDVTHGTYFGGGDQSVSVTSGDVASPDTPSDNVYVLTGPGDFKPSVGVTCSVAGGATVSGALQLHFTTVSGTSDFGPFAAGATRTLSNFRAILHLNDGSAIGTLSGGGATLDSLSANLAGATASSIDLSSGGGQHFTLAGIGDASPTEFNIPESGNFAPVSVTATAPGGHDLTIGLGELKAHASFASGDGSVTKSISCTPSGSGTWITSTVTATPPVSTYLTAGSLTLKTLAKGAVPLTGAASATIDPSTGAFSGSFSFNQATAKLTALGIVPVVAKVSVEPTGPATGTLTSGVLSASLTARIKLPSITVFGASIGGGSTCQTTRPSTIPLKSTGAFSATSGGTLAGTFAIGNLSGCGALNGLISPVAAGSGNSILLKLMPSAPKTA